MLGTKSKNLAEKNASCEVVNRWCFSELWDVLGSTVGETMIYSTSLGRFAVGQFETLSLSKDSRIPRPSQAFH